MPVVFGQKWRGCFQEDVRRRSYDGVTHGQSYTGTFNICGQIFVKCQYL